MCIPLVHKLKIQRFCFSGENREFLNLFLELFFSPDLILSVLRRAKPNDVVLRPRHTGRTAVAMKFDMWIVCYEHIDGARYLRANGW